MKLKWQISIIAVLSLSFPLVVWLAFKSLNQTFQDNMLAAADKQAQVIVNSVQQFHQDRVDELSGWIAGDLSLAQSNEVAIDGNLTEWEHIPWYRINHRMRFKIGRLQQQTHLVVEVLDNSVYTNLNNPADRIILALGETRGIKKITINRQAEGPVFNQLSDADFVAYWHEMATGYQVEIKFPDLTIKHLGLAAINHASRDSSVSFGHLIDEQIQLTPLFETNQKWQDFLQQITPDDGQLVIRDMQNRIYYQTENLLTEQQPFDWLTEIIYELAFDADQSDGNHFFGQRVSKRFAAGQIELTIRHTDAQMSLIQTFIQSISRIFLIALALLLGYFIYAMVLAWRIKRLNKTLQHVMDDKGHIQTALPSGHAKDEIGDLSRGMSSLLVQINDYTDYLKQLGSRLSHEMKTPISIVHTSLEVLHMEQPENEFVNRALSANNRLKFILNQLSALSRLKQTITETEVDTFEINAFIKDLTQAYQLNIKRLVFKPCKDDLTVLGSQELMAQMLDKLVQNAVDFIGPDDQIMLATEYREKTQEYVIKVSNTGSQIPPDHIDHLFDSLTSFRDKKSDQPHLGLGLYIVKLICEFHQAQVQAQNLSDPEAVQFSIIGKISPAP
ncbi:ATP-binding protein [Marinicella litoralis]|uniref:histidine kinase n=1 Tax=Marinicella litoralis TaxID=644220 RepID=A0A4R6XPC9_9GAMM|nr:ATP-binding protein [Marinicella litoralis]TDR19617.1 signal transduction histidine kinase [Marinicella litoralis]